jgi:hypothetical protein
MSRARAALSALLGAAWIALGPLATASAAPPEPYAGCQKVLRAPWVPIVGAAQTPAVPLGMRPAKGEPVLDAIFGTCVVRVTQHDVEPPRGFARNDYSRRQAFNADGSRILIVDREGGWHLYDGTSLAWVGNLKGVGGDAEPQWHATDPNRLYYVPRNGLGMTLMEIDIRDPRPRVAADFGARLKRLWPRAAAAWTRSEGSPSADLRYWAFQVDDDQWKGVGMFTWDLQTDTIIAHYDFALHAKPRPDHLSMSPSGRYVVVSWDDGPALFDRDLHPLRGLATKGEHSDIALDANGNDVYVSVDYEARGGPVYMTDLKSGKRTLLFDTYVASTATAMHFSGKAFAHPGWVVISTYGEYSNAGRISRWLGNGGAQWLHGKVMAVELRPGGRIVQLANHHSHYDEYWTEPQASVNRDLTRILFNSNWDKRSKDDVDAYMVVVPPGLPK